MDIENESNEPTIDNNIDEEELDILDENYIDDIEQYASNDELADLIVEKILQHDDLNRLLLSITEQNPRSRHRGNYRGQRPRHDESYRERVKNEELQPKTFYDLVQRDLKPLVLGKEFGYLHDYLKGLSIANRELLEDFYHEGFPVKRQDSKKMDIVSIAAESLNDILPKENLELLYRIENFMLVMALKPLPAFIEEPLENRKTEFWKKTTSVGKEFLFLLSKSEKITKFNHEYLTAAVKIFVTFLKDKFKPYTRDSYSLEIDISRESIMEMNRLLFDLRDSWMQGRYDAVVRHDWRRGRVGAQYRNFNEFKKKLKSLALRADKDRARIAKYKMTDIVIYRFQIELYCNRESIRHDFFGKFFTALFKTVKQSSGISELLDYINVWKEMSGNVLQADAILFFDANKLAAHKNKINQFAYLKESFERIAKEQLTKENEKLEEDVQHDWEILVNQIPILLDVSTDRVWLLERKSPQWKVVDTQLIPYLYIMDSFEREYSDSLISRISGGRSPREKKG
ncbi:hypothetical protein [Acinetobacter sp. ESBL14]|uniref:hypothetical protein n=1 Tax=Acinetobacter sp. ESBL14 TaxID=3077329 RepID=UPI002FC6D609